MAGNNPNYSLLQELQHYYIHSKHTYQDVYQMYNRAETIKMKMMYGNHMQFLNLTINQLEFDINSIMKYENIMLARALNDYYINSHALTQQVLPASLQIHSKQENGNNIQKIMPLETNHRCNPGPSSISCEKDNKQSVESSASTSNGNSTVEPDCLDENQYDAKFRDIFARVSVQFPNAHASDIVDGLDFIRSLDYDLSQFAIENLVQNISNYIDMRNRKRENNLEPTVNDSPRDACSICFEQLNTEEVTSLKCFHVFHTKCLKAWMKQNPVCPICRKLTFFK